MAESSELTIPGQLDLIAPPLVVTRVGLPTEERRWTDMHHGEVGHAEATYLLLVLALPAPVLLLDLPVPADLVHHHPLDVHHLVDQTAINVLAEIQYFSFLLTMHD